MGGELQLRIRDDGGGYAREFIESQIATLLSYAPQAGEWSSGESVLPTFEKIGALEEFQVAFLSLFALKPSSLRIQTGERNSRQFTILMFEKGDWTRDFQA